MKKFYFLLLLFPLSLFAQILDEYPKGKDFYAGGMINLYQDIHQIIVDKNLPACENRKEVYNVKLLLTKEAQIKFVTDFDTINISKNKCAYDLSQKLLRELKNNTWTPAEVRGQKFDSVVEFFILPDHLFEKYTKDYDPAKFYMPATYQGGKLKFDKDLHANFMTIFTDYDVNGSFYLDFYIDENGKITDPSLHPKVRNSLFTSEVYRTLKRMNKKWNPAILDGIPVKSKISIPMTFSKSYSSS